MIFFVWLVHGQTEGYKQMFKYVIAPLIKLFDKDIEAGLENLENMAAKGKALAGDVIKKNVKNLVAANKNDIANLGAKYVTETTAEELAELNK